MPSKRFFDKLGGAKGGDMDSADPAITGLLQSWRSGDTGAQDRLVPLVYERLRGMAGSCMRGERPGHTLEATALVHEAYLKLAGSEVDWQDRAHFFAVASMAMRRVLVDHARQRNRVRRGAGAKRVDLDEALSVSADPDPAILEMDRALTQLAGFDARMSQILELTYFGGLSHAEICQVLGISEATVKRDLKMARSWLLREMDSGSGEGAGAGPHR